MNKVRTAARLKASVSGLVLVLAMGLGTVARAQDAAGSPDQNGTEQGRSGDKQKTAPVLETVVVTAERRSTDLQKTSVAASVLEGDQLAGKGVTSMQDLQNATPSLSIQGAALTQNVNIRGIGLDSGSPAVVPGVATYRDGLWQPPVVNTDSFYDIDNVQVLRGPQGTFVGSNSTGGALFIDTKNPNFDGVNGYVEAQGGNYGDYGASGAVNLPVSDTFAIRAAGKFEDRDSFYKQIGTDSADPGSLDEKNGRIGLLWQPNDDLKILFKSEANYKDTGGYAYTPAPGTTYYPYTPADPFTLDFDTNTKNQELGVRNVLQIDWNVFGGGTVLRSITGYQYFQVNDIYDTDATSRDAPLGQPKESENQLVIERPFSQELNLISPDTGKFQWILGAYYLHDTRKVVLTLPSDGLPSDVSVNLFTTLQAEAVFGQATYNLTPSLQVQAGLRYTHDSSNNRPTNSTVVTIPPPFGPGNIYIPQSGSETDSVVTGKVAINYTVDDDNYLYAFAARGSKAGGFNAGVPLTTFQPEFVMDYEAGWKATMLDGHLRTQLGGFYDNYQNLQVGATILNSGQNGIQNIGKSVIDGIEASGQAGFGNWGFDFGGAYVHSALGSVTIVDTTSPPFPSPAPGVPQCTGGAVPPACFNYTPFLKTASGAPNPFSPTWTFNAGTQYTFGLANSDTLTPRVNYTYMSSQWSSLLHLNPLAEYIAGRGLWNVQLTYTHGDWSAEAFATNLLDTRYVSGQFGPNNFEGDPRQYGLRLTKNF